MEKSEIEGDAVIRTTEEGWSRFLQSTMWKDLYQELTVWRAMILSEYSEATTMEEVARIQGKEEALMYILGLPEQMMEAVAQLNKAKEKEREGSNE